MRITAVLEGYWLDKQLSFSPRTVANYTHFFNRFYETQQSEDLPLRIDNEKRLT